MGEGSSSLAVSTNSQDVSGAPQAEHTDAQAASTSPLADNTNSEGVSAAPHRQVVLRQSR